MENIFQGTLVLNTQTHESFLRIFGQEVLALDKEATVKQVEGWVKAHYERREDFRIYSKLNPPLRMLTSAVVRARWPALGEKMLQDLTAMVDQTRDRRQSNRLDIASFETVFSASYLKEGQFGIALKQMLYAISHPIGSKDWQESLKIWFTRS